MWPFNSVCPGKNKKEYAELIEELIQIGKRDDFLSEHPGGQFDSQCRHVRTRKIGERLLEIGGASLMEDAVKKISKKLDKQLASHLEYCWYRIGNF